MFRFTIRELVLLTIIVAMGCGWGLDHALQRRKQREIEGYSFELFMQLRSAGIAPPGTQAQPSP